MLKEAEKTNLYSIRNIEETSLPTDLMVLSKLAKKYNQNRVKLWRQTKGLVLKGLKPLFEFYDTNPIQVSEAVFVEYMNSVKYGRVA